MKALNTTAYVLVIIGALNWLLVGLLSWDIGMIFGSSGNVVARVIYILVGLSGIVLLFTKKTSSPAPAPQM